MKKPRYYYGEDLSITEERFLTYNGENIKLIDCKTHKLSRISICGIWDTDDNTLSFGVSVCSPKDLFNKKIARSITYQRALKKPYCIKVIGDSKVSDVFMETSRKIEAEVMNVTPIKVKSELNVL